MYIVIRQGVIKTRHDKKTDKIIKIAKLRLNAETMSLKTCFVVAVIFDLCQLETTCRTSVTAQPGCSVAIQVKLLKS